MKHRNKVEMHSTFGDSSIPQQRMIDGQTRTFHIRENFVCPKSYGFQFGLPSTWTPLDYIFHVHSAVDSVN